MVVKVILCLIVKNEASIIQRCIKSCIGFIDAVCISDTGSTDNTVEIIKECGKKYNIPTRVNIEPFKDFGYNRTVSLNECAKFIEELKEPSDLWYALHLDADMEIHNIKLDKQKLNKVQYYAVQQTRDLNINNVRFTRMDIKWICKYRIHECWACDLPNEKLMKETEYLPTDVFYMSNEYDSDAAKDNNAKYNKYLTLLFMDLEDTPDDPRSLYYIGQSYDCLKRTDNAINYYIKYTTHKNAEKNYSWASYYNIGLCSFREYMKDTSNEKYLNLAKEYLLKAYIFDKERSEPLLALSLLYKEKDDNLALHFALLGNETPYPKNNILFIERETYEYKFLILLTDLYHNYIKDKDRYLQVALLNKKIPINLLGNIYNKLGKLNTRLKLDNHTKLTDYNCVKLISGNICLTEKNNKIYETVLNDNFEINKEYEVDGNLKLRNSILFSQSGKINLISDKKLYTLKQNKFNFIKEIPDTFIPFIHETKLYHMISPNEIFYNSENESNDNNINISNMIIDFSPIKYKNGYLYLVSESFKTEDDIDNICTMNRFIYIQRENSKFVIKTMSGLFKFGILNNETCLSMADKDDKITFTYSVGNIVYIGNLNKTDIDKRLIYTVWS